MSIILDDKEQWLLMTIWRATELWNSLSLCLPLWEQLCQLKAVYLQLSTLLLHNWPRRYARNVYQYTTTNYSFCITKYKYKMKWLRYICLFCIDVPTTPALLKQSLAEELIIYYPARYQEEIKGRSIYFFSSVKWVINSNMSISRNAI